MCRQLATRIDNSLKLVVNETIVAEYVRKSYVLKCSLSRKTLFAGSIVTLSISITSFRKPLARGGPESICRICFLVPVLHGCSVVCIA